MKKLIQWQKAAVISAFGFALLATSAATRAETVWIESENTATNNAQAAKDKLNVGTNGSGSPQFLSGGNWFVIEAEAKDVESATPAGGIELSYKFNAAKSGNYQLWNRVGFEFVRSPFEWRVDGGAWKIASPEDLTTDLMELSFFIEVAWLNLGAQQLSAGAHTLEIRIPRLKNEKGETQRILYASDAIAISDDAFRPNGKWKPGEDFQNASDKAAAKQVFALPAVTSGATSSTRSSVQLKGNWEVTRHDEQMPGEVAAPIKDLPTNAFWTAIAVPSDKNKSRPDLMFAHRLWYRTRVNVPQSEIGKAFKLNFPMNSLNTTVYVNGTLCGFNKNPLTGFSIDVTKGIKAGVNEVWVGIRDAWYGRTANPDDPMKLRRSFNLPIKFFGDGFQDLAYPIWNNPQSGILETPVLESVGSTYVSDIFVKPAVVKKQLNAQITLSNTTNANRPLA